MVATWLLVLLVAAPNLAPNGDFEALANGYPTSWSRGWCRAGADQIKITTAGQAHSGQTCLHVVHTGAQDWSLQPEMTVDVREGDLLDLAVWAKIPAAGELVLCSTLYPPGRDEKATNWSAGALAVRGPVPEWKRYTTRVVVTKGFETALPRLIGTGPAEVFVDDFEVTRGGNLADLRAAYTGPARVALGGQPLAANFAPQTQELRVTDQRTGRTWQTVGGGEWLAKAARADGSGAVCDFDDLVRGVSLSLTLKLTAP